MNTRVNAAKTRRHQKNSVETLTTERQQTSNKQTTVTTTTTTVNQLTLINTLTQIKQEPSNICHNSRNL